MANPRRGEIWRVDLAPTQGSETGKIRPVVVVGNEQLGRLPVDNDVDMAEGLSEQRRNYCRLRMTTKN